MRRVLRYLKVRAAGAPYDLGNGATSYACAECATVVLAHVGEINLRGLTIRCPQCGEVSEI